MNKFVALGGLPRSCSTLMVNMLAQNPRFHATPTSPLCDVLQATAGGFMSNQDAKSLWNHDELKDQNMPAGILGFIQGWYYHQDVVFDKSRAWLPSYEFLRKSFGPETKVIVPIRDLRGIAHSMEKIWRRNPYSWRIHHNAQDMRTSEARLNYFIEQAPVGQCFDAIRELVQRIGVDNVLIIRAEDFCEDPYKELKGIYEYIGEDFEPIHDKKKVKQVINEHDPVHGIYGDHKINEGPVTPMTNSWEEVWSPESLERFISKHLWYYQLFYPEVLDT